MWQLLMKLHDMLHGPNILMQQLAKQKEASKENQQPDEEHSHYHFHLSFSHFLW